MDIYNLIQNNRFDEACIMADSEFTETGSIFPLRNKVYALLHLKKYEEGIALTEQLIGLRKGQTDIDYIFCGINNWALGKTEDMLRLWRLAENSSYKDAAGGIGILVLLYFYSIKMNMSGLANEILKKMEKLMKGKMSTNWPGPLGSFLLNYFTIDDLLKSVAKIEILAQRQMCEASFVIGLKELEKANSDGYVEGLKKALSYSPAAYLEPLYYLADIELSLKEGY